MVVVCAGCAANVAGAVRTDVVRPDALPAADLSGTQAVPGEVMEYEVSLRGIGTRIDGKTLLFEAVDAAASQWDCSGGDLDARFRPQPCRTTPTSS